MFRSLALQFSLAALLFSDSGRAAPTVSLPYGTFQGFTNGTVTSYLGLPFASSSRFEVPKPPKVLHGVQNATEFGPACPQQALSSPPDSPFRVGVYPSMSEDCLTLNVFVPAGAHNLSALPVLVWIFGGGFQIGDSRDTNFTPLVERSIDTGEPIIVVAPNYRLNALGFLPGREVGAVGASNPGLRDQIFALEWVKTEIIRFGGDPKRVVIGGFSGGAIAASTLVLSNKQNSNTLFRGAFLESGAPSAAPTLAEGQPVYDALVLANNCTSARDTLDCLRNVPLESIMATVNKTENFLSFRSLDYVWRPYIDGDVVERAPVVSVAEGLYANIPIVSGNTDDEGTLFSLSTLNITTDAEFLGYIRSITLPKVTEEQVAEIGRLYPSDPALGAPFNTGSANQLSPEYKRLAAFQGDLDFTGPRRFFFEHASRTQATWSWLSKLDKNASELGSLHGSDGPVWFTNTTALQTLGMDALANFVNTLDPNRPAVGSAAKLTVAWPQWKTGTGSGSGLLYTFSDTDAGANVSVTLEDFRVEPIAYLNGLVLQEAGGN
ncbi:sterol esterase [Mycena filopes]|nr:sterol esterase [Mycena filopes]